jgi:hypothetical protein
LRDLGQTGVPHHAGHALGFRGDHAAVLDGGNERESNSNQDHDIFFERPISGRQGCEPHIVVSSESTCFLLGSERKGSGGRKNRSERQQEQPRRHPNQAAQAASPSCSTNFNPKGESSDSWNRQLLGSALELRGWECRVVAWFALGATSLHQPTTTGRTEHIFLTWVRGSCSSTAPSPTKGMRTGLACAYHPCLMWRAIVIRYALAQASLRQERWWTVGGEEMVLTREIV